MKRLLEAFSAVRKEYDHPSVFHWPMDEQSVIRAGSVGGALVVNARDDMNVYDLQAFVRDNRHRFPEKTNLRVYGQSDQSATIAINAIESMAPFSSINIIPSGSLDSRWTKDTPSDLTNIKTDVPILWHDKVYGTTPIFDPSKVRDLSIVGPAHLIPSSDEIRLRRLTISDPAEITGIHYVKPYLLSLKLYREVGIAAYSFKEFSSLKVLDLRRGLSIRIKRRLPEIVLPPSLDTLKLTGFKWGVVIHGKVNCAKLMPDFHGTPGEYRFNTPPDFIWVTPTSARYIGVFIRGNIDDYKVVAGEVRNRPSGDRDQIQTTSAPFFAVKVR
jgi:hypothetical protein